MFLFFSRSRVALFAGGDVLALLLFSAVGRFSHGYSVFDFETLRTADPFIAGIWLFVFVCCFSCLKLKRNEFGLEMDRVVFGCLLPWGLWRGWSGLEWGFKGSYCCC